MLRSRYRRILFFFFRILFSLVVWELAYPFFGLKKISRSSRSRRLRRYAAGFRLMSVEMGGVLIKVGQFLSTRVDVLPIEITEELSELQDEVPAEKFENIREIAEAELKMPLEAKYHTFDEAPIAAASLGQVHHATMCIQKDEYLDTHGSNTSPVYEIVSLDLDTTREEDEILDVVVKIQRKNIERLISIDLAALRTVGKWIHRYPPIKKRVDIPSLLDEFTRTLYEEIDYLAEGRNAEIFSNNFRHDPDILIPKVIWSHTTKRVLTLEDVRGIKVNDYDRITASGINRDEVATRLLNTYLKQIFEDGFFHADPHPGNLFISPYDDNQGIDDRSGWKLTFVDFGMVGRLPPQIYDGMRELLIALGTRDAGGVVKASQKLGFLLPGADLKLLERAEVELFDRFWGKNMMELSNIDPREMVDFAREFRQLLFVLPFQIPKDILFLGRAVGILSGICTGLNPHFNVWEHLVPFAKRIVSEEFYNPKKWIKEIGSYVNLLFQLPLRLNSIIDNLESGEILVREVELAERVKRMEGTIQRLTASIIFFALFLSGILIYMQGYFTISLILIILSIVMLIYVSIGRSK